MEPAELTVMRKGAVAVLGFAPAEERPSPPQIIQMIRAMRAAVARAEAQADVAAVVLVLNGPTLSVSAAFQSSGRDALAPQAWSGVSDLCSEVAALSKPVVAALAGQVIDGSFELALAARYRVAQHGAQIGFPATALGLLPSAGGALRAARLAGAAPTLALLWSGAALPVTHPSAARFCDETCAGRVVTSACAFAEQVVEPGASSAEGGPPRAPPGLADPKAYQAEIAAARAQLRPKDAQTRHESVAVVEAALLLPLETGLAYASAAADACATAPEARALQHIAHAEHHAVQAEAISVPATALRDLGLVGLGTAAPKLAADALAAGLTVSFLPMSNDRAGALDAAVAQIWTEQKVPRVAIAERLSRLRTVATADALSAAGVIVGDGPGHAPVLDAVAAAGARAGTENAPIFASTAHLDGGATGRVFGLVVAQKAFATELLWSPSARHEDLARLGRVLRHIGHHPLGFCSARSVTAQLVRQRRQLIRVVAARGRDPTALISALAERGISWPPGDTEAVHAETIDALDVASAVRLVTVGMASAGLVLLRSGVARCAGDLDALSVASLGYARRSGGMMFVAASEGLIALQRDLALYHDRHPRLFQPAPELTDLIKEGWDLSALTGSAPEKDAEDHHHQADDREK